MFGSHTFRLKEVLLSEVIKEDDKESATSVSQHTLTPTEALAAAAAAAAAVDEITSPKEVAEEEQSTSLDPQGSSTANEQTTRESIDSSLRMMARPTASSWWLALEERRKSRRVPSRKKWLAVLLGQVIALVATSMNAASFTLSYHSKVDTQLFQLFIMYVFLSIHFLCREEKLSTEVSYRIPFTTMRLQMPWWIYLLISLLDVMPNYLQLLSFNYTSLTSTTLLGSLTVPSTIVFSSRILARCFGTYHYLGVLLCVIGGGLTVWADYDKEKSSTDVHSGIGDLLAVLAALIYGLGDVISEYCVKHVDRYELLGMLGLYGAIFTGLTFPWIEGGAIVAVVRERSSGEQVEFVGVLAWYTMSVLLYYMAEAFFLVASDATLLNLSIQASNLWAILFSFLAYNALPPLLFYPALVLVVSGVCLYELKSTWIEDVVVAQPESQLIPQCGVNHYAAIPKSDTPLV